MSRILVWSPNYAPELTGIPPLVTDACEWLADRGHAVEVVTAMPNYPDRVIRPGYRGQIRCTERVRGVTVHRSWLRVRPAERFVDKALYELSFAALSAPLAARHARSSDVLLCVVPSLAAAAAATALARAAGVRTVLWIQDLVLCAARSLDGLGFGAHAALALAGRVERAALRAADRVVVCNPAFGRYAADRGVDPARVRTIFNWADLDRITRLREPADAVTRFLYAGNVGYTQGLETVIEAAQLAGPNVRVDIVGRGNAEAAVRALAADTPNVTVAPPVSNGEYPALLGGAHAHLVVQRAVGADANFPSKIASYLASGRPVVASIASDSVAGQVLAESGAALLVAPESPAALAAAFLQLHDDRELRAELGSRARRFAEQRLRREDALAALEESLVRWPRRGPRRRPPAARVGRTP